MAVIPLMPGWRRRLGLPAAPWYGERRWVVVVCPGLAGPKAGRPRGDIGRGPELKSGHPSRPGPGIDRRRGTGVMVRGRDS